MKAGVFLLPLCLLWVTVAYGESVWPIPYQRHSSRPPSNPYCKAEYAFCPTGRAYESIASWGQPVASPLHLLQATLMATYPPWLTTTPLTCSF